MPKARSAPPAQPLPAGTLTFLFTDIEGSTRLWEAHPEAMRSAVARHDGLLRQSIAGRGGHVFKTGGDAFCAAFATAPDAIGAVLSAQQALHAELWPEDLRIRVRMALHTGSAESRDGDYFGAPLNHVARLLAIGHGAQTLVSEITRDLCRDRLPAGASLKPLGPHGLKDVTRHEAVFQLCHAGLPSSFPPLRTATAPLVADATPSIAVLPFINMSGDEENEYFADGLSEELLNVLASIRGLRVASRTSAFSFKGSKVDLPTVAEKLNVANVLEGSVRKAGKRVRVAAQLIEAATDSHLWSKSYDRELDDIFAVQDDIAQSVVRELRAALLGEPIDAVDSEEAKADVHAATKGRGENAEAYRLYLQGKFFAQRLTEEGIARAIKYLRQAVDADPGFALGWAGLSRAHADLGGAFVLRQAQLDDAWRNAREAALRALALEPDLAEAHAALGTVQYGHDLDWTAADISFRRALELAPGNVTAMRLAAQLALTLGRTDEALALARRATSLDPLSPGAYGTLESACEAAGDSAGAEAAAAKAIELNPGGGYVHKNMGFVRFQQGRFDEALAEFGQETDLCFRLQGFAMVHHVLGHSAGSDAALRQMITIAPDSGAFQIAEAHGFRGDADAAFAWLERAYLQRDGGLAGTKISFALQNLHGDERWQPFLRKLKLVD